MLRSRALNIFPGVFRCEGLGVFVIKKIFLRTRGHKIGVRTEVSV